MLDTLLQRYRRALADRLAEGRTRRDAEAAAFDANATALQRQRSAQWLKVSLDASLADAWTREAPQRLIEAISPAAHRALRRLCELPEPPARTARSFLIDQLGRFGVVAGDREQLVVNPHAVARIAAVVCPIDSEPWRAASPDDDGAAARLVAPSAAAASLPSGDPPPAGAPVALQVAALQHASAAASDTAVGAMAGALRRAWAHAAFASGHPPAPPPSLLADATGGPPWWRHVNWAPLLEADGDVLAACVDATGSRVPPSVRGRAFAYAGSAATEWLRLAADEPPALPPGLQTSTPFDELQLLAWLRGAVPALEDPAAVLLSSAPASSAALLALAAWRELPGFVEAQLAMDRDWLDFDAPGEGSLPSRWRDALRLSPAWSADWAGRFEELLDETTPTPADVLGAAPCPSVADAGHHGVQTGPMSGYTHGIIDEIEEAYGDVHAPADPFSKR